MLTWSRDQRLRWTPRDSDIPDDGEVSVESLSSEVKAVDQSEMSIIEGWRSHSSETHIIVVAHCVQSDGTAHG
jgi:hypothetical protein